MNTNNDCIGESNKNISGENSILEVHLSFDNENDIPSFHINEYLHYASSPKFNKKQEKALPSL